jgi:dimethylglycine dehydrogenase
MDVARFGDWATLRYTNAKVRENYSRRFSIRFPNEELPAGRPHQTTPIYDVLVRDLHAVMGDSWGLEAPLWFAPSAAEAQDVLSFHRSNDFPHVGAEVRAVREGVGVTEIANFAKYEVTGPGAEAFLDRLMTNRLPKAGRLVLTPMLNPQGRLIGDFTIARASDERFLIWGSLAATKYHMRWFEAHLPKDGSVVVRALHLDLVGLSIAGPKSREVLAALVDADVSNAGFRFLDFREMDVAGAPAMVNRITYTGDLGYEIWMKPAFQRRIYSAIKEAGAAHGIRDFGLRALLSMRFEKNFPTWFAELRPIYGAMEGAMERFVAYDKPGFIGREAALAEREAGPRLRRVTFVVDADGADAIHDEPIWARVGDTDFGTISAPHGHGAPRFDATGRTLPAPVPARDGDWRVVGWITSGGYGHYVGLSLAQGYVPASLAGRTEDGVFEVEILGQRRAARIAAEPPFDPTGSKMRG